MKLRLVLPILTAAAFAVASPASAQGRDSRFEIGAQASVLRLSDFDSTSAGVGGRFSVDLTPQLAIETEFNLFPSDDILLPVSSTVPDLRLAYYRRRADAFFGLKVGRRQEKVGLFAKARPGFVRLTDKGQQCLGADCARVLLLLARPDYRTELAFDVGGGLEVYLLPRTVARVELGDTIIRHRSTAPPCPGSSCTSHNVSTRLGLGVRF